MIELIARHTDVAVEAGCGTGIASSQVAARGVRVIGVEPDTQMAAVARSRGIDATICRFEDWMPQLTDALDAAQSWHWITFVASSGRIADRPG